MPGAELHACIGPFQEVLEQLFWSKKPVFKPKKRRVLAINILNFRILGWPDPVHLDPYKKTAIRPFRRSELVPIAPHFQVPGVHFTGAANDLYQTSSN